MKYIKEGVKFNKWLFVKSILIDFSNSLFLLKDYENRLVQYGFKLWIKRNFGQVEVTSFSMDKCGCFLIEWI